MRFPAFCNVSMYSLRVLIGSPDCSVSLPSVIGQIENCSKTPREDSVTTSEFSVKDSILSSVWTWYSHCTLWCLTDISLRESKGTIPLTKIPTFFKTRNTIELYVVTRDQSLGCDNCFFFLSLFYTPRLSTSPLPFQLKIKEALHIHGFCYHWRLTSYIRNMFTSKISWPSWNYFLPVG